MAEQSDEFYLCANKFLKIIFYCKKDDVSDEFIDELADQPTNRRITKEIDVKYEDVMKSTLCICIAKTEEDRDDFLEKFLNQTKYDLKPFPFS